MGDKGAAARMRARRAKAKEAAAAAKEMEEVARKEREAAQAEIDSYMSRLIKIQDALDKKSNLDIYDMWNASSTMNVLGMLQYMLDKGLSAVAPGSKADGSHFQFGPDESKILQTISLARPFEVDGSVTYYNRDNIHNFTLRKALDPKDRAVMVPREIRRVVKWMRDRISMDRNGFRNADELAKYIRQQPRKPRK